MKELVSVIIPCYNSGRTLISSISSIKNQTYKNIEIIVVNDGSNDQYTIQILNELSFTNDVKILHKSNGGLASARNHGIRNSSAKFILPLDADDELNKNSIYDMLSMITKSNPAKFFVFPNIEFKGLRVGISPRNYNPFVQLVMNQLPYSILFTRQVFDSIGGYDEYFTDGLEDWEFNLSLIEYGLTPVLAQTALLHYNVNSNGMLLSKTIFKYFDIWSVIKFKHKKLYTFSNLFKNYFIGYRFKLKVKLQIAVIILLLSKFLPRNFLNIFLLIWLSFKSTSRTIRSKF